MKNQDNPLQTLVTGTSFPLKPNVFLKSHYFLAPNEFTDKTDSLGLFEEDPDPITYFSIEKVER